MVERSELVNYLNQLLQPQNFKDYAPNGLQVEGVQKIYKLVAGVSANQELIDTAIAMKADAILVHHGFFWKNEAPELVGIKRKRLASLLEHNINLIAYHLPLDAHREFGNNTQLGIELDFKVGAYFKNGFDLEIPCAEINITPNELTQLISKRLNQPPIYVPGKPEVIKKIAWCTGAAQDYLECLGDSAVDAYVTGEISERTYSLAREMGIHFYAAGHHATERYGVRALAFHLAKTFQIHCEFIDIPNPI